MNFESVKEINIEKLRSLFAENKVFHLIDVREQSEWDAGFIEKAHHLPRGTLPLEIEKLIPEKDTCIVLYCAAGYRSALAAMTLQEMNYTNVYSLQGGYQTWSAKSACALSERGFISEIR